MELRVKERTAELTNANRELRLEITERERAEQALRDSEAKYQDLYENAPDMCVSVDAESARILQCNQTLTTVLGYRKEDIIGRPIFDMYHPDCMEDVRRVFRSFVETGVVNNTELQLQLSTVGSLPVFVAIILDITERKKIEDEVRRLNEELEERVAARTAELEKKTRDLEKFNMLFVDRELRMVELKEEIKKLKEKP